MPQCTTDFGSWARGKRRIEWCQRPVWVVVAAVVERVIARYQTRRMNGNEIWSDQPSTGYLPVALKHKPTVVCNDVITMLAPNAWHLVPRRSWKDVVYDVQVVPKEKEAEDPV